MSRTSTPVTGRRRHRRGTALAVLGIAAATMSLAFPAAAAKPYPIDTTGMGTFVMGADGSAHISGTSTGKPFDGTHEARLVADDGALPLPGECEPATATLRLDGSRDRFVEMTATGTVCGKYPDATYVVTQSFTGRYVVEASTSRRLVGSTGFMSQLITVDGRSNVLAIATQ